MGCHSLLQGIILPQGLNPDLLHCWKILFHSEPGKKPHWLPCARMWVCSVASVMSDSATLWTIAHQALLSMRFSRQEHWNELPWPPPRYLPDPGIASKSPGSPALQVDSLPVSQRGSPLVDILPSHPLTSSGCPIIQLNSGTVWRWPHILQVKKSIP